MSVCEEFSAILIGISGEYDHILTMVQQYHQVAKQTPA